MNQSEYSIGEVVMTAHNRDGNCSLDIFNSYLALAAHLPTLLHYRASYIDSIVIKIVLGSLHRLYWLLLVWLTICR